MPRTARHCPAGFVYHIWNRAAGRLRLFKKDADYLAFERILLEAHQKHPLPLLDWCLMPNHWHFVVYPTQDAQVTHFFRWLTHTHAMRAITHRRVLGMGPLYQGRFKSLPVQHDDHLLTLLAYVQRNPVRAKLVDRCAQWRWTASGATRSAADPMHDILADWPIDRPADWDRWINRPQSDAQTETIRQSIRRGSPYGDADWTSRTARKLHLTHSLRPVGRPKIKKETQK